MEGQANENVALDVKPLRFLTPMFPTPFGFSVVSVPGPRPFLCVSPVVPFPTDSEPPAFPSFMFPNAPDYRPVDAVPRTSNNAAASDTSPELANANATPTGTPGRRTSSRVSKPANNGEPLNLKDTMHPTSASPPMKTTPRMATPLNEDDGAMTASTTPASGRKTKRVRKFV